MCVLETESFQKSELDVFETLKHSQKNKLHVHFGPLKARRRTSFMCILGL
jgi:hypothetical protein